MTKPKQRAVRKTSAVIVSMILSAAIGIVIIVAATVRAGDMGTFTWTTVVMPLVGLFLLIIALWQARELPVARELDRTGVVGEGVVIGKWTDRSRDESRRCYVAYQHGDSHQARQRVSWSVYRQLELGDTVEVRYLQRDPKRSRMVVNGTR
jgi:hypothetical protein